MEIEDLINRLREVCQDHSLRNVATACEVSHETIRNLISANSIKDISISLRTFRKIEQALTNEF